MSNSQPKDRLKYRQWEAVPSNGQMCGSWEKEILKKRFTASNMKFAKGSWQVCTGAKRLAGSLEQAQRSGCWP